MRTPPFMSVNNCSACSGAPVLGAQILAFITASSGSPLSHVMSSPVFSHICLKSIQSDTKYCYCSLL